MLENHLRTVPRRLRRRILFGFRITCHAPNLPRTVMRLKAENVDLVPPCRQIRLAAFLPRQDEQKPRA